MAWNRVAGLSSTLGASGGTSSAIDTTGADLIVVAVIYFLGAESFSDSKGNTWTLLTSPGASPANVRMYYCRTPTVGTGHTFTSTGQFSCLFAEAWSGSLLGPLDAQNSNSAASTTSLATGSITPATDGQLLIAAMGEGSAITNVAIDSSFTLRGQIPLSGGVNFGGAIATRIQATAAAINPTFSWTGSSSNSAEIASFKVGATPSSKTLAALGVG